MSSPNEIILYQSDELPEHIEGIIDEEKETFWLSFNQISSLFQRDKSVFSRHLKNIFKDNDLEKMQWLHFLQQLHQMAKRLGNKWFAFSKMEMPAKEIIEKLPKIMLANE